MQWSLNESTCEVQRDNGTLVHQLFLHQPMGPPWMRNRCVPVLCRLPREKQHGEGPHSEQRKACQWQVVRASSSSGELRHPSTKLRSLLFQAVISQHRQGQRQRTTAGEGIWFCTLKGEETLQMDMKDGVEKHQRFLWRSSQASKDMSARDGRFLKTGQLVHELEVTSLNTVTAINSKRRKCSVGIMPSRFTAQILLLVSRRISLSHINRKRRFTRCDG
ncbi:hypothetical protein GJAV_G00271970 [Gymnothorax javanicus]|nr:hypothetical protein GJAV_G00271970 [Gymnothorax javanicus]